MREKTPLELIEDLSWPVRANEDIHLARPCIVTINLAAVRERVNQCSLKGDDSFVVWNRADRPLQDEHVFHG